MDARTCFVRRKWTALKTLIAKASPDEAYTLITGIGHQCSLNASIDGLVDAPNDALGLTVAGGVLAIWAQRARGFASAAGTSDAKWQRHFDLLGDAGAALQAALRIEPDLGLATALLLRAAVHEDQFQDHAVEALKRARNVPSAAYLNLMNARSAKWGGSHEDMWRVVRQYRDASLPGTLALVGRAHFEHWFYTAVFDEEPGSGYQAQIYFNGPEVLQDLMDASDKAFSAGGDIYATRLADGWLAREFTQAEKPRLARRHLQRLGKFVDEEVWTQGGAASPRMTLMQARMKARLFL